MHLNLIDTAGIPDFRGPTLAAMTAVETTAVVVNAHSGIELATRRLMRRAKQRRLCRMIIINRIDVEDVAKRLIDFGFHAPTMSWPVPGTLMIEPTESESLEELDRFCESMITIHGEIMAVKSGEADSKNNVLKNAPHTAATLLSDDWDRPYSREQAAYPADWTRQFKFWPVVSRIDNVFGDRNLVCTCDTVEAYAQR